MTALSSDYLKEQTKYLARAIAYIWSLYEEVPPGIILIGHSMGGLVIQSLILEQYFDHSKFMLVISLAAPYVEPRT